MGIAAVGREKVHEADYPGFAEKPGISLRIPYEEKGLSGESRVSTCSERGRA